MVIEAYVDKGKGGETVNDVESERTSSCQRP